MEQHYDAVTLFSVKQRWSRKGSLLQQYCAVHVNKDFKTLRGSTIAQESFNLELFSIKDIWCCIIRFRNGLNLKLLVPFRRYWISLWLSQHSLAVSADYWHCCTDAGGPLVSLLYCFLAIGPVTLFTWFYYLFILGKLP